MSDEVAARTQESIDKFWAEKQWGVNEINSLMDEHLRTPYKPEKYKTLINAMRTIVLDTNCLLAILPSVSPYHNVWTGIP